MPASFFLKFFIDEQEAFYCLNDFLWKTLSYHLVKVTNQTKLQLQRRCIVLLIKPGASIAAFLEPLSMHRNSAEGHWNRSLDEVKCLVLRKSFKGFREGWKRGSDDHSYVYLNHCNWHLWSLVRWW